jgi:hypothetical protein
VHWASRPKLVRYWPMFADPREPQGAHAYPCMTAAAHGLHESLLNQLSCSPRLQAQQVLHRQISCNPCDDATCTEGGAHLRYTRHSEDGLGMGPGYNVEQKQQFSKYTTDQAHASAQLVNVSMNLSLSTGIMSQSNEVPKVMVSHKLPHTGTSCVSQRKLTA